MSLVTVSKVLTGVNRRFIFLLVALAILSPLIINFDLESKQTSVLRKIDKKIDKAIKYLEKSLDDKFWTDNGELVDDKKSKKIFDKEKKSVKILMKIIKKGNSGIDSELTDIILLLVGIDRDLALNAINLVSDEVQDKDKKQLVKAEKALEKGDKQTSKGKYDKAIDKYKKAWKHAQKAIKQINH